MTLKQLAASHDHYASDKNYHGSVKTEYFDTWTDFYEEHGHDDADLAPVFRWDVFPKEEDEGYEMQIIIIVQTKGIYLPILIENIHEQDVPKIENYLKPHFEKLLKNWQPLSGIFQQNK